MLMLVYSALLTLGLLLTAPLWLFRMATTGRYREGLAQRLGFIPAALREAAAGHRVVWLHAVSVGETLAATRLVAELEAALGATPGPAWRIVISTTTRTGQALAKDRFGADRVFYMPLDFAFAIRAYLKALQPEALILMESELWPRLLHECTTRGIPVAVVNARMSDRSYRRAQRVRALWSRVLRMPTLWLAQSDEDSRRLHSLVKPKQPTPTPSSRPDQPTPTLSSRPEAAALAAVVERPAATAGPQILTTGNLKYDIRASKQSRAADLIREIAGRRPIIVAGSTVGDDKDDEEYSLTTAWGGRARNQHDAMLVLAPRHPERFSSAWQDATEFPAVKLSEFLIERNTFPTGGFCENPSTKIDVILLDTIGDLSAVYGVANIAFVGGSLQKRGGHNPLEPAQFGVPVIMGPSFENFRDIVGKMQEADGIRIVQDSEELEATLTHLLAYPEKARALGQRGRAVFEAQQGATARTVSALLQMMQQSANAGALYLDPETRAAATEPGART